MTAYNVRNKLFGGGVASRQLLLDPGDAGTINVDSADLSVVICTGAGSTTRTLEAAANVPVGAKVLVISQATSGNITVNSIALGDGEFAEFTVTLDSSGDEQWVQTGNTDLLAAVATNTANIATVQAGTSITGDTSTYNETSLQLLLDTLETAGLITNDTT